MILESPGSIAFHIGPFAVHWYGLIIAIASITGLIISTQIAKKQEESPERILDLATYLIVAGAICARLYYVVFNWQYYSQHLGDIVKIWQGGLSIHGALIGGFIALIIYTRIYRISLLKYTDILSYGVIVAQAIGRWGNFFNSEAFGAPTTGFIKLYVPPEARPEIYQSYSYFHPTFLYESIWNIIVFFILFYLLRPKLNNYNGAIFFSYLTLYSIGRLIIEGIRIDSINSIFGLPLAQFISIILIIIGICGLYIVTVYRKQTGQ